MMIKKTWKMELKEKVEKMESELKEWEGREMSSWIGKWGRSLMITKLKKEIRETYKSLSE